MQDSDQTNTPKAASGAPKARRRRRKNKPRTLRCFIGLAFPLHDALQALQEDLLALSEDSSPVRLAPADNLHVTLKFLGAVPEDKLPDIKSVAASICENFSSMTLTCQGIGVFKQSLWVGFAEHPQLGLLADALNQAARGHGIALDDKDYLPHVTVARFGKSSRGKLTSLIEKYGDKLWGQFEAKQAHLYLSETHQEGARYTIIKSFAFKSD